MDMDGVLVPNASTRTPFFATEDSLFLPLPCLPILRFPTWKILVVEFAALNFFRGRRKRV